MSTWHFTEIIHGPNPDVKAFIEKHSEAEQRAMWELYGFINNTFPDIRRRLLGELKHLETNNPAIQRMVDQGLLE